MKHWKWIFCTIGVSIAINSEAQPEQSASDLEQQRKAGEQEEMQRSHEWRQGRLLWPVAENDGSQLVPTHSSFMDPSWTGNANHTYPRHTGMDIGYFDMDGDMYAKNYDQMAKVVAAADGKVVHIKKNEGDACGYWMLSQDQKDEMKKSGRPFPNGGFPVTASCGGGCDGQNRNCAGNYVVIDHDPDGKGLLDEVGYRYTAYYHLQKNSSGDLDKGSEVKQGEVIGIIGSSGNSMSPHLHFEVHKQNFDVGSQEAIEAIGWSAFYASLVDPFYSLHDGSNNRVSGGSSKWVDQCFRDMNLYGKVGTFLQTLEGYEYELNSGSINPRYLVTASEGEAGKDFVDDGSVDYSESESWKACGTPIGGRVTRSYLDDGGSYDEGGD